jgi:hypothetical protein
LFGPIKERPGVLSSVTYDLPKPSPAICFAVVPKAAQLPLIEQRAVGIAQKRERGSRTPKNASGLWPRVSRRRGTLEATRKHLGQQLADLKFGHYTNR